MLRGRVVVRWFSFPKLSPQERAKIIEKGRHHCSVCCKFYWRQLANGKHFGHEHPKRNASWNFDCISVLERDPHAFVAEGPMCEHDLVGVDKDGRKPRFSP